MRRQRVAHNCAELRGGACSVKSSSEASAVSSTAKLVSHITVTRRGSGYTATPAVTIEHQRRGGCIQPRDRVRHVSPLPQLVHGGEHREH